MTKKHVVGALAVALCPFSAFSEESSSALSVPGDFSGSLAITSDYTFRGITQTDENPAIQGSVDYSLGVTDNVGVYAGAWGSNVDFNDNSEASSEFDYYGGVTYTHGNGSIDVGIIYYDYPGADDSLNYDFVEFQAALGYASNGVQATASINVSPENFGESGDAQYYKFALEFPLVAGLTGDFHVGRQEVDDNTAFGNPDYTDWSVGVGYTFEGLDLKGQYIDTSIGKEDCADGCDARGVVSVSKSF